MSSPPPQVLFCPFCRESFEQVAQCPSHDLPLVPLTELPSPKSSQSFDPHQQLPPWEWRFGRGMLWLGAILLALSFPMDSFQLESQGEIYRESALALVLRGELLALWLIPLISACAGYLPIWASTPHRLQRLRRPMLAVVTAPPAVTLWALFAIRNHASTPNGTLTLLTGGWLVLLASGLCLIGATRLGSPPRES